MRLPTSRRSAFVLLLLLSGSLLAASPASAATITVSTFGDQYAVGAACSLREALYAARTDLAIEGCPAGTAGVDTIVLGQGTYELNRNGAGEDVGEFGDLDIRTDVVIRGAGIGKTTIDGNSIDRIFDVDPSGIGGIDVSISKLTIRGGKVSGGGGIRNGGNLTLSRVALSSNESTSVGGAIDNDNLLSGSLLSLVGNRASSEGGAIENSGTATLADTTIRANSTGNESGAINNFGAGEITLRRSTIEGNSSSAGGSAAIEHGGATLTIEDTTISGNTTTGNGGAVRTLGAAVTTIRRSTIVNNSSGAGSGGGIDAGAPVQVSGSILSNNAPQNCMGAVASLGANIDSGVSCAFADPTDLTSTDPSLRPLGNYGGPTRTHALRGNSPAIDSAGACTGIDQRGVPRPFGSGCDRGSYERAKCAGVVINRVGTDRGELLTGTKKADGILALGGNDRIRGRKGNDGLCGGKGKDRLSGGPGKDRLRGGKGRDVCIGGPGADRAATCEERQSIG